MAVLFGLFLVIQKLALLLEKEILLLNLHLLFIKVLIFQQVQELIFLQLCLELLLWLNLMVVVDVL